MTPSSSRLRPLDAPRPIRVLEGDRHIPLQVRPARTWLQVASVRERWRIDDEWWREPIRRVYFEVVLEDGRVSTLYRDCTDGRWYLHGKAARDHPGRRRG